MVSIMSVNSAAGTTGRTARQEQTVFGIFGSLLRRKSWVLLPTFLAFALALGYVISTPPAYRAEATLLVEPQETPFTRPQSSDSTERLADRPRGRSPARFRLSSRSTWRTLSSTS